MRKFSKKRYSKKRYSKKRYSKKRYSKKRKYRKRRQRGGDCWEDRADNIHLYYTSKAKCADEAANIMKSEDSASIRSQYATEELRDLFGLCNLDEIAAEEELYTRFKGDLVGACDDACCDEAWEAEAATRGAPEKQ